ncbi:Energy-coupling factor transporter ATP-binding protein EcfA1 [Pleomorphomonas sp. T1.2MG-36]|uniref:energy-coupling factor ABC transporter ATP-binding protein n=1 Tax=Pleomorphomonas sp. T1.2MG-36 TaxID=3041167 RepID=UPI00247748B4|nr:ATP-binding cassette domain-containing protein [Pleomorphomonas sp. T1.2MG-36]CAI9409413.1 Energy-coupling factor transporter ATP-binding protein EcfA1 [Pleomorphomonas sp. T1.2MG-36]
MVSAVEVNDFSFRYRGDKRYAVRHLDFAIREGEVFCVIGANGSGKSTLCNALVGLVPHYFTGKTRGDVVVDGTKVSESTVADLSSTIGLVFQNPFNQLSYTAGSVAEELAYGLGNHGVERSDMLERVDTVARLMRIEHILHRNPLELSGGQVQRVALGSVFILEPRILVLDECTTQLDPLGAEEIFDVVRRLNDDGVTIVMVDHDMERVARCADTVLVLDQGEIAALGTPREVFTSPTLQDHGVNAPDYVNISRALIDSGWSIPDIEITEEPTVATVRGLLR